MNNLISTIIKAGLIVGTLDILSAFLYYFIRTGDKNVDYAQFLVEIQEGKFCI